MRGLAPDDTLKLEYEEYHDDYHRSLRHRTMTVQEFEGQLRVRFDFISCDRADGKVEHLRFDMRSDERPDDIQIFRSIESRRGFEFLAIEGLPRHISPELEDTIAATKRWRKDPSASLAGEGPRLAGGDSQRKGPRR